MRYESISSNAHYKDSIPFLSSMPYLRMIYRQKRFDGKYIGNISTGRVALRYDRVILALANRYML